MKTLIVVLAVVTGQSLCAQLSLDIESGAATFGYNDVRIPGAGGTGFSLKNDFRSQVVPFFRARINYTIGERHTISALFAPLSVRSEGVFDRPVNFAGETFAAETTVLSEWKFNSYRLSYQYSFIKRERLTLAAGLTAKIRDAKIALRNDFVSAEKTNVGFVPIIRLYGDWSMTDRLHLILDADALASSQGRAEDVLLALGYDLGEHVRLKLGYRLLEGGADNDEVYNFSAVHYAAAGVIVRF